MAKWTEKEITILKKMYRDGSSYREIAIALNRTITSISGKVAACGLLNERKTIITIEDREEWKEFFNGYMISSLGRVANKRTNRILASNPDGNGYYTVCISISKGIRKTFKIHRLVALNFIPNPDNLPEVNHIKGDLSDNKASSLEWITRSDNMKHAVATGLLPVLIGEKAPNSKITELTARKICKYLEEGVSRSKIESLLFNENVTKSIISKIARKITWSSISKDYNF